MKLRTLPFLITALIASCSPGKSESTSKNAIHEYEIVEKQSIDLVDCLSQEEDKYLVFVHSKTCLHCQEIIEDVISFASSNTMKTYFLDISKQGNKIPLCSAGEIEQGINRVEDIKIAGTPTLLEVEEGIITFNIAGKDSCLSFLNEQTVKAKDKNIIA